MYIKIVGDTTKYQGKLERIGTHIIRVSGIIKSNKGFRLYLDNDTLVGDYSSFIYSYDNPNLGEGIYEYTDNNASYEEDQNKPSKEEEEKQKIRKIIDEYIGNDIRDLVGEVTELYNLILPLYDTLGTIEEALGVLVNESEDNE